jgi:phosphoribosylanthranilate isomerase
VLLAGGLDHDNVAEAVRAARPFGIDCARGIESMPGIKDHDRLRRFVAAAREADR